MVHRRGEKEIKDGGGRTSQSALLSAGDHPRQTEKRRGEQRKGRGESCLPRRHRTSGQSIATIRDRELLDLPFLLLLAGAGKLGGDPGQHTTNRRPRCAHFSPFLSIGAMGKNK